MSRLKRLIQEIHRRSLHENLTATATPKRLNPLGVGVFLLRERKVTSPVVKDPIAARLHAAVDKPIKAGSEILGHTSVYSLSGWRNSRP